MKILLRILLLVVILFLGKTGYGYYNKYKHSKQLKIGVDGFKFPQGLNLNSLVGDVPVTITQLIKNFSPSPFSISQINIDVYTPSGVLVAEQKRPLSKSVTIKPDSTTTFPITFTITTHGVKQLIKEAGGAINIGANYLASGTYGIPVHLKGFVIAEGVTIEINEKLTV